MKKHMLILIFMYLIALQLSAQNNKIDKDFFFYIPTQKEVDDYFGFHDYLIKIDKSDDEFPEGILDTLFKRFYNQDSLHGLLFESFLRNTRNLKIQDEVKKYLSKENIDDPLAEAIITKYNSKIVKVDNIDFRYSFHDELFDENIDLYDMEEVYCFGKELGITLFNNDWVNLSFDSPDTNSNQISIFLTCGGATNAMNMYISELQNTTFEDFYMNEVNDNINSKKYDNWRIAEIEPVGYLSRSGADKIFIGFGTGSDTIPEIDTATFAVYMYNDFLETGFSVIYFMNFSKSNMYYKIRKRIWNQLFMNLNFVFININE